MLIDSHCHLNHKRLLNAGGSDAVISRAKAENIGGLLTICCRIAEEFDEILALSHSHENVWCTVGTHPHDAGQESEKAISQQDIERLCLGDNHIIGVGESGLDYFYKHSTPEDQQESFRKHIRVCIATGLPLVVHARDADEDIIKIIREEGAGTNLKGVMHCFSSGRKMGEEAVSLGFYISFSGILTFDTAEELRAFARDVPVDRLLVETDAPYLAPHPYRGKINEPAFVRHTATLLAELKSLYPEQMAQKTTENFFTLFSRARETFKPWE